MKPCMHLVEISIFSLNLAIVRPKGGFKSEDTGGFLLLQNKYSKALSWAENLNKLFTDLGVKFKFSAQDSDLEYLFRRSKDPPVSSDIDQNYEQSQQKLGTILENKEF